MFLNIEIKKVVILRSAESSDQIFIHTALPPAINKALDPECLKLSFNAQIGTGVEYVRKNFGIEPEVIVI